MLVGKSVLVVAFQLIADRISSSSSIAFSSSYVVLIVRAGLKYLSRVSLYFFSSVLWVSYALLSVFFADCN